MCFFLYALILFPWCELWCLSFVYMQRNILIFSLLREGAKDRNGNDYPIEVIIDFYAKLTHTSPEMLLKHYIRANPGRHSLITTSSILNDQLLLAKNSNIGGAGSRPSTEGMCSHNRLLS